MNIAIITTWWTGAGAGEVSLAFARVLIREGHNIYIYARHEEGQSEANSTFVPPDSKIQVWEGKKSDSPLIKSLHLKDFKHFISENEIDVIIFNEQVDLSPVVLAKELGILCIAYVDYYREDTVKSFEIYDALICNTRRHFSVFSWHPNSWFLPWGVDSSLYSNIQLDKTATAFPFFHSCSYDPVRKGTDILLDAMIKFPEFRCTIHASPSLETTLSSHKRIIKILKEEGRIKEINRLVRQPGLYSLGSIYVYPSRLEGIGLSILEAQANGLHLIAPDTEPFSEFAIPFGSTLVPPKLYRARSDAYYWPIAEVDAEALGNAMGKALKQVTLNPNQHVEIKKYIFRERDIFFTHRSLGSLIENLTFRSVKKSDLKQILDVSSQKVPILYRGRFKHAIFKLRKALTRV